MKSRIENFLFNGYVKEPIPIVLLALLVGVVFLIFAIWASVELVFPPSCEPTTKETQFVKYEQDGPIYSLLSSDGQSYDLPVASIVDDSLLDSLINNGVSVLIETDSADYEKGHSIDILSLSLLDGTQIVPSDRVSASREDDARKSALIMWVACLIYWIFVSVSYYFVSHATRYPRIASVLVREHFRNF